MLVSATLAMIGSAQITLSSDNLVDCVGNDIYFDSTSLKCTTCPSTGVNSIQLVPKASKQGCECPPGHIFAANQINEFFPECEACGANEAASADKTRCMGCDNPSTWTDSLKDCVCPQNFYVMEVEKNGEWVKECS